MSLSTEDHQKIGFWGNITSTMDWCEENYEISYYIAEFWNTLSNLAIIFYALFGIVMAIRQGQPKKRYIMTYNGLFLVGIGSFLFHCTLSWEGQLLDEIPMVVCSMPMLYCMIAPLIFSKTAYKILKLVLTLYPILFIIIYVYTRNFVFFFFVYGTTVITQIAQVIRLSKYIESIVPKSELVYPNCPKKMFKKAVLIYGAAFIIWTLDNMFCPQLKFIRNLTGPYIAPFFELHAYWHLGSGYATYLVITGSQIAQGFIDQYCPKTKELLKKIENTNLDSHFSFKNYKFEGAYYGNIGILPYAKRSKIEIKSE